MCKSLHENIKSCNLNSCVVQITPGINSGAKGLTIRQHIVPIKQANPFLFNAGITVGETTVSIIQSHCFTSLPPGTVFKPECTLPYSVCHLSAPCLTLSAIFTSNMLDSTYSDYQLWRGTLFLMLLSLQIWHGFLYIRRHKRLPAEWMSCTCKLPTQLTLKAWKL